jgi:hypothetical protein
MTSEVRSGGGERSDGGDARMERNKVRGPGHRSDENVWIKLGLPNIIYFANY